jgi:hypothetical protein
MYREFILIPSSLLKPLYYETQNQFPAKVGPLKSSSAMTIDFKECKSGRQMKLPLALLDPFFYYYLKIPAIASTEHLPGKMVRFMDSPKNQMRFGTTARKSENSTSPT